MLTLLQQHTTPQPIVLGVCLCDNRQLVLLTYLPELNQVVMCQCCSAAPKWPFKLIPVYYLFLLSLPSVVLIETGEQPDDQTGWKQNNR